MMRAMRKFFPVRRLLALAAAYVVALQLALLPLTVAAGPARSAPLCSELAGTSDPVKADAGCACAAGCGVQCCAPGYPAAPTAAVSLERKPAGVLGPAPTFVSFAVGQERGPHNPRAPPSA